MQSTQQQPELIQAGFQIHLVNYDDPDQLQYACLGCNVVISTVPGRIQIKLIDAAISAGVSRFAPAEFQGLPELRPSDDELDDGKADVLNYLHANQRQLEYTCFVCGILYEHFAPDGLYVSSRIGKSTPISEEGSYVADVRRMIAEAPRVNSRGQPVTLQLTAGQDVGRFVQKALSLPTWPPVLTMSGERMTIEQMLGAIERVRGRTFYPRLTWRDEQSLHAELGIALTSANTTRYRRLLWLIATTEGRFDFQYAELNALFPDVQPLRFETWLDKMWNVQR